MTRSELLKSVLANITILLHDDTEALKELCISAIEEYQSRSGFFSEVIIEDPLVPVLLPENFLEIAGSSDANSIYAETSVCLDDDGNKTVSVTNTDNYSTAPFTVSCLIDIVNHVGDIPPVAHLHLKKYLRVLIDIPNTERLIASRSSAGLPLDGLPSIESLESKKLGLEQEMTASGFDLMPVLIM